MTKPTALAQAQPVLKQATIRTSQLLSEVGESGLVQYMGDIQEQPLRQLKNREIKTWTEMYRYDPIIAAVMRASTLLIRGATWREEPASISPEDEANAEFLGEIRADMSHSWNDMISETLTFLPYGFSYAEIVMKRRLGENRRPGLTSRYNDGRLGIRKIAFRSQDSICRWQFDDEGGIQAAVQRSPQTYQEIPIPIEKSLLFRTETTKNNPQGRSLLEGAFIPWWAKKRIQEYEWIRVERDATGVPVAWVPPELLASGASAEDAALLETFKKIVRGVRLNEQGALVLPLSYDDKGHKIYEFELMAGPQNRMMLTGPIIARLNQEIAMSALADVILLGHEKVGSFALASSKTNLFAAALGAYLDIIEETLNRHLVPRLFRWNGIQAEQLPRWRHGDIESVDLAEIADLIQKMSMAGAPLFPSEGGELERVLLEMMGLPAPSEDDFRQRQAERAPRGTGPSGTRASTGANAVAADG